MSLLDTLISISCLERQSDDVYLCKETRHIYHGYKRPPACCPLIGQYLPSRKFVTLEDLVTHTEEILPYLLPFGFQAVLGVSRSGLIPATILANRLHLPLLIIRPQDNQILDAGHGRRLISDTISASELRKMRCLIIDDSTAGGSSAAMVREVLKKHQIRPENYIFLAIYGSEFAVSAVDAIGCRYELPHYFSWNYLNSQYMQHSCLVAEGILLDEHNRLVDYPRDHIVPKLLVTKPESQEIISLLLETERMRTNKLEIAPFDLTPDELLGWKLEQAKTAQAIYYVDADPVAAIVVSEQTPLTVICPTLRQILVNHEDDPDNRGLAYQNG